MAVVTGEQAGAIGGTFFLPPPFLLSLGFVVIFDVGLEVGGAFVRDLALDRRPLLETLPEHLGAFLDAPQSFS